MTDTSTKATAIFDTHAGGYDAARRRLIPPFDAFYATAVEAVRAVRPAPRRILDLGAGTGLLSSFLHSAFPHAALTLIDGAPAMLEQARASLGTGAEYVNADLLDPLPEGPWSAIVSALAIHHLDDDGKRVLSARVLDALAPGGVFVNAEQVSGPTPALDRRYAAWHERSAKAAGTDEGEWTEAVERMAFDRCSTVESQLSWLRETGFCDVDCLFKDHRFAVMVGRRPTAP